MSDLDKMTDWEKLKGLIKKNPLEKRSHEVEESSFLAHLRSRVKGQDPVIEDVARLIALSYRRESRARPVASLLFLGPTGTGKTELAKAISEYLFEDESTMLRFDCSELASADMGKTRLVGSSPGFVGSDQGGQLTRPMFANGRRVVLFDEIEKAHPSVFDLFLQMMGEGRLTEQATGRTADFTQAVIVLTSNAQAEPLLRLQSTVKDYHELVNALKSYLAEAQVFRPEILGRIDKLYLFKPLAGIVIAEVALMKVQKLGREYGLGVSFVDPELVLQALEANAKVSRFGIRELERIVFDLFAGGMVEAKRRGAEEIAFAVEADGKLGWKQTKPPPEPPATAAG